MNAVDCDEVTEIGRICTCTNEADCRLMERDKCRDKTFSCDGNTCKCVMKEESSTPPADPFGRPTFGGVQGVVVEGAQGQTLTPLEGFFLEQLDDHSVRVWKNRTETSSPIPMGDSYCSCIDCDGLTYCASFLGSCRPSDECDSYCSWTKTPECVAGGFEPLGGDLDDGVTPQ